MNIFTKQIHFQSLPQFSWRRKASVFQFKHLKEFFFLPFSLGIQEFLISLYMSHVAMTTNDYSTILLLTRIRHEAGWVGRGGGREAEDRWASQHVCNLLQCPRWLHDGRQCRLKQSNPSCISLPVCFLYLTHARTTYITRSHLENNVILMYKTALAVLSRRFVPFSYQYIPPKKPQLTYHNSPVLVLDAIQFLVA